MSESFEKFNPENISETPLPNEESLSETTPQKTTESENTAEKDFSLFFETRTKKEEDLLSDMPQEAKRFYTLTTKFAGYTINVEKES